MNLRSLFDALTEGGKTAAAVSFTGCFVLLVCSFIGQDRVIYLPHILTAVAVLSVLAGGFRGGMAAGSSGWLYGSAVAVFYLIVLNILALALFNESSFAPGIVFFVAAVMAAGLTGGVAGVNLRFMRRRKRRYVRN